MPSSSDGGDGSVAQKSSDTKAATISGTKVTTSSGRSYNLSTIRATRSKEELEKTPGTVSSKSYGIVQSDPSWTDLASLEAWIYDTIPYGHDPFVLTRKINNVRGARQSGDETEYVRTLLELLDYHHGSFASDERYSSYKFTPNSALSPKNAALLNAKFLGKNRDGKEATNVTKYLTNSLNEYKASRPDLSDYVSSTPGQWTLPGALSESGERKAELIKKFKALGVSDLDAEHLATAYTASEYHKRANTPELATVKLTSPSMGHTITIGMDPTGKDSSGRFVPVISKDDFLAIAAGIDAPGKLGFYQEKIHVQLAHSSTKIGSGGDTDHGKAAGYTFDTDKKTSIVIIPDRIKESVDNIKAGGENHWSTDVTDMVSAYKHVIVHEVGHRVKVQKWGDNDKGANSLLADVKHFTAMVSAKPKEVEPASLVVDDSKVNAESLKKIPAIDLSSWKKVGGALGSNEGGIYEHPTTGERVYMKFPDNTGHAANEILASSIYNFLGVSSSQTKPGIFNGKRVVYSAWLPNSKQDLTAHLGDSKYLEKIQDGFAVDALLANWDVAGSGYNNIVTNEHGDPVRIDPGGSLLYRAQGSPKGAAFTNDARDLDSMVDPGVNRSGYDVFGSMSTAAKTESAKKLLNFTDEVVDAMVGNYIADPKIADELKAKLKARRDAILNRYNLGSAGKTSAEIANEKANRAATPDDSPNGLDIPVSKYGATDPMENFAEMFAKYVITDQAPEWFVELLKSKGLEKRQISQAWRQTLANHGKTLFQRMTRVFDSKNKGESLVPDKTSAGGGIVFRDAYLVAGLLGVTEKMPNIVDKFPSDAPLIYRGLRKQGKTSGKTFRLSWKHDIIPYFTKGIFANTMYSSSDRGTAESYAGYEESGVEDMAIHPDTKILVIDGYDNDGIGDKTTKFNLKNTTYLRDIFPGGLQEIGKEVRAIVESYVQNELHPEYDSNDPRLAAKVNDILNNELEGIFRVHSNHAILAMLLGFDGAEIRMGSNESYYLTLDRSTLYMKPEPK